MWNQAGHPFAASAMLLPCPRALHDRTGITLEEFDLAPGIKLFAALLNDQRLIVERIHLAGSTRHEKLHNALGFGGMVQATVQLWARLQNGRVRQQPRTSEQMSQSNAAEASSRAPQKLATVNRFHEVLFNFDGNLLGATAMRSDHDSSTTRGSNQQT